MDKDQNQPHKSNNPLLLTVILMIVVAVVALGAWYWHDHKSKNTSNASANSGVKWDNYKATQYGFQFSYPDPWGTPSVMARTGSTGIKYYVVGFNTQSTRQGVGVKAVLGLDPSLDFDQSTIQKRASLSDPKPVIEDSSSYATIYNLASQSSSAMTMYQAVNLTTLKITSASIQFGVSTAKGHTCPQDQFSSDVNCVMRSDYDTVNRVAKSIQNI